MLKKLISIFILFSAFYSGKAYELRNLLQQQADISALKHMLLLDQQWVPFPDYYDRQGWDNLTDGYKADIIRFGEEALDYEWRVVKATDYIEYNRSGSRQIMQSPFNANQGALGNLIMAELAEGKGRFMDQIVNGIWLFCEMTSWALSAHLGGMERTDNTALPSHMEHIIDLTAGNLGSLFSWTLYFLEEELDKVNPLVAERLRHNLQVRILDPFMERDDWRWQAFNATPTTMVNNWTPWCNSNVLASYLLLENDPDKLAVAVHRSMISVDQFINYYHDDGAADEGPSYWNHAAGKMYDYLQLLYYATERHIYIFDHPVIKNMGEYIARSYIGDGWMVNFANAGPRGGGPKGVIFRYGKAVNSMEMQQYAAYLDHRDNHSYISGRDMFRNFEDLVTHNDLVNVEPRLPDSPYSWFPGTEFCYMRNNTGFFFAAKGGYNAESHNHNDVGSFLLYYNSKPVFIDVGSITYTRQISRWNAKSDYHNLPVINGKSQSPGRNFRSRNIDFNSRRYRFSVDIAGAYGDDAEVVSWVRTYTLKRNGGLTIEDSFKFNEIREANRVNFISHAKPDIYSPGVVILDLNGDKVELSYDANLFNAIVDTIEHTDLQYDSVGFGLSNAWGNTVYRLNLVAKRNQLKGNYRFTVKAL
jgi:hypothetical protein